VIETSQNFTNPWLAYGLNATSGIFVSNLITFNNYLVGCLYENEHFDRCLELEIYFSKDDSEIIKFYNDTTTISYI
jgi:hypothetical protein